MAKETHKQRIQRMIDKEPPGARRSGLEALLKIGERYGWGYGWQAEAAREVGVASQALNRFIRGRGRIGTRTLARLRGELSDRPTTAPTAPTAPVHDEFGVMRGLVDLDGPARGRVLRWAHDRFGADLAEAAQ